MGGSVDGGGGARPDRGLVVGAAKGSAYPLDGEGDDGVRGSDADGAPVRGRVVGAEKGSADRDGDDPPKGAPGGDGAPNGFGDDTDDDTPANGLPVGDGAPNGFGDDTDDDAPENGLTAGEGAPNGFGDDFEDAPANGLPVGDGAPNGPPDRGGPPKGVPDGGTPKGVPVEGEGPGVGATGTRATVPVVGGAIGGANGSAAARRTTFCAPHLGHCARTPRSEMSASSMMKAALQASQSIRMRQPYRRGQTDATGGLGESP
jgi:hypothetical protein